MEPIIIELPLFDLKYNKIRDPIKHVVELHETFFLLHRECYFDSIPTPEDIENSKFEEKENCYMKDVDVVMKSHIQGVDTYIDEEVDVWVIGINYSDRSITLKFEKEKQMRNVANKILFWLTSMKYFAPDGFVDAKYDMQIKEL